MRHNSRAQDDRGASHASGRKDVGLLLKAPNRDRVLATGLRYVVDLEVPAGRQQLRLAARDRTSCRAGSVFVDLDVPRAAGGLYLSDPLVVASDAVDVITAGATPAIDRQLPGPTSASRAFARTGALAVGVGVQADATPRTTIDLSASVRDDDGAVVFAHDASLPSTALAAPGDPLLTVITIPLRTFVAGRYVLTLTARSRLGDTVK